MGGNTITAASAKASPASAKPNILFCTSVCVGSKSARASKPAIKTAAAGTPPINIAAKMFSAASRYKPLLAKMPFECAIRPAAITTPTAAKTPAVVEDPIKVKF